MKNLNTLLIILAMLMGQVFAQERYLDEVFSTVKVTEDTAYGANISIYPIILGQSAVPALVPLRMDVYEPDGDTATNRPVVIVAPTGTFFDPVLNNSPYGSRKDYFMVEFCTRLAKMGYVAVAATYRKGWNPVSLDPEEKRKTILEAAYRGIQDMRSCARYFRATHAGGNGWGINPDNIIIGGTGTGGYVAYGTAFLNDFAREVQLTKFFNFDSMPPQPYVDTLLLGDPYGVDTAILNLPNFPTMSSEIKMGFALGGALGDVSWVDADSLGTNEPPFAAMQNPEDLFAPYMIDDVIETINYDVVIRSASGAYSTLKRSADSTDNNDIWKGVAWKDPYNKHAATINDGIEGLYPVVVPYTPGSTQCLPLPLPADTVQPDGAPWYFFDENFYEVAFDMNPNKPYPGSVAVCREKAAQPLLSVPRANLYIDTIVGFLTPRMALAMGLATTTDIEDLKEFTSLEVYPNPANNVLNLRADASTPILGVEVRDAMGRLVKKFDGLRNTEFSFQGEELSTGIYFVRVQFKEGMVTEKVLFE